LLSKGDPSNYSYSAILPTFNRVEALKENIDCFLALERLGELVVVDDCSTDETSSFLMNLDDARLIVVRHPENRGSPTARATGVAASNCPWILMLEDDCRVPTDYAVVLMDVARTYRADVVGAPWVHAPEGNVESVVAERRAAAVPSFNLATGAGCFPSGVIQTPFMPALALISREVFSKVSYDSEYRGNAWREETSFFISAVEQGFRSVITPDTYSYQIKQWTGGQRRNPLAYEFWVMTNNWRFLRKHEGFLRSSLVIRSPLNEQGKFMVARGSSILKSVHAKALRRLGFHAE
jgi:glycosyltransferase involved in cell wall biosynthesis